MDCNSCTKPLNTKCIKCACGYSIHFECLYNTYILPNDYTNISQSKYAIYILSSQHFKFICESCIFKPTENITELTNPKFNTNDDKLDYLTNITTNINQKLDIMNSEIISFKKSSHTMKSNTSTILNNISSALSSLPDTLNKTTSKSFSDIVKSTLPTHKPTVTKPTPKILSCSSQPSVVIEHISPDNRNLTYIKSLFKQLELDSNTITDYSFISHCANLVVSSSCIIYSLINSRSDLQPTDFKSLFIRPFIASDIMKIGRIYFHASKSSLTKFKCVLNMRSLSYQLRNLINTSNSETYGIDWKSNPYIPDVNEFLQWSNSYENYLKSKKGSSPSD